MSEKSSLRVPEGSFSAGIGAGAVVEAMSLITHGGLTGLLVSLTVAGVGYVAGPKIWEAATDMLPVSTKEFLYRNVKGYLPGKYGDDGIESEADMEYEINPEYVQLSREVQLSLDDIAGKAIFVVGQRRSGKTTLGARIAEELGGHYIPMFIPDYHGDYQSVIDFLPRGVIAHAPGTKGMFQCAYAEVSTENARQFGYNLLENGWQVILNMRSYDTDEACEIIVEVIAGLLIWAKQNPDQRTPCEVFLDEAQALLPQDIANSVIQDKQVFQALLRAYGTLVAEGGKFGLTPVILSQRFAETNKKIMAQAEIRFVMRQTNDNDLDRCMAFVNAQVATSAQIAQFQQGEGVYIGSDGSQVVTRFYKRHSDGRGSETPKAQSAKRFADMPMYSRSVRLIDEDVTEVDTGEYETPIEKTTDPKIDKAQEKRAKIIQTGARLKLEGKTQADIAKAVGLTQWTIRPYLSDIATEAERLREEQEVE